MHAGARGDVEDTAAALVAVGLSRLEARALAFLATREGEALSVDVERGAGMRQPDVSQAMRDLARRGLVAARPVPKEGKGRPALAYRLAVSFQVALDALEQERRAAFERDLAAIARLRARA